MKSTNDEKITIKLQIDTIPFKEISTKVCHETNHSEAKIPLILYPRTSNFTTGIAININPSFDSK